MRRTCDWRGRLLLKLFHGRSCRSWSLVCLTEIIKVNVDTSVAPSCRSWLSDKAKSFSEMLLSVRKSQHATISANWSTFYGYHRPDQISRMIIWQKPVEIFEVKFFNVWHWQQLYCVHCPPGSPHPAHITSSQSPPSLSSSVTPSTFHSRLKAHLFHKSFPP